MILKCRVPLNPLHDPTPFQIHILPLVFHVVACVLVSERKKGIKAFRCMSHILTIIYTLLAQAVMVV